MLLLFKVALALVNDIDLRILAFNDYGKGFMKTAKVSPDAFIQMALQLAYYKVINIYLLITSNIKLFLKTSTQSFF